MKIIKLFCLLIFCAIFLLSTLASAQNEPESNFDAKISEISKLVSTDVGSRNNLKIVISDFQNQSKVSNQFSQFLQRRFEYELFKTRKFIILERTQLDKIAKERKLQLNNATDAEVNELGKLIGADAILTGSYIVNDNKIKIITKLIETETAKILSVSSIFANMGDDACALIKTSEIKKEVSYNNCNPIPVSLFNNTRFLKITANTISITKNVDGYIECEISVKNDGPEATFAVGNRNTKIKETFLVSKDGSKSRLFGIIQTKNRRLNKPDDYSWSKSISSYIRVDGTLKFTMIFDSGGKQVQDFSLIELQISGESQNESLVENIPICLPK